MKDGQVNQTNEHVASTNSGLSRREFLTLGSGLFLFFALEPLSALQEGARSPWPSYPADFNSYLHINPDGRVTCSVGKIEMGQGNMTSLAQLLAEELDVALDSVDMVMGDTELCPWDMGTFGSLSIRYFGPVLRGAGAEARAVLLQMASERLRAPVERLQVKAGVVTDPAQKQRVSYAELVQGKRIERHLEKVPVKPVSAFSVVGQSPQRKDALEKVTGQAKYAGDITVPGMLHARILRPPAHGATLKSADTAAAAKVTGIRVVKEGELVAVLHERPDIADKALALIKAEYEPSSARLDNQNIFDHLVKAAPAPTVVGETGSLAQGEKLATTILEQTYLDNYIAHAPIETHSALAMMRDGKMTIWASTQTPFPMRQEVARTLGLPPEKVHVITPYVGGGFGGKGSGRQAVEAARLAKLTGQPVQLVWSREEEFFYDTFRPAGVVKVRAGTNAAGKLVLWDYTVYGAGSGEARQFYAIPHERTQFAGGWQGGDHGLHAFAVGPWRAPAANTNSFARESHIDTLASKLGIDPLEFRLNNLSHPRLRRVLEAAAKQFGWKPGKAPSGRGFGIAVGVDVNSFVATMAHVEVDKATGRVQVKRVVCVQDQGVTISPDGSRQQIEGGITMGLGYALREQIRFQAGQILDRNFDSYELPRFSWVPTIETVLIDNPHDPASGCGEPAIITVGAVIANAIFDAVGARVLQMPMTPERVKEALK
jgi:CO/xanthine dehydrogenase Mo-binding subunit